ncbi:hypothetical protein [Tetragenococcus halophilus]|uniref:hypothetical protein n=1 Tax=Tetragenococcus halophilus TaxID=51669 RepID=UPI0015BEA571|nr:hypothetical protein [Tetragenococcus halophilus]NWO00845.1 hypothetical protein [Tetragenococcus halophilus]
MLTERETELERLERLAYLKDEDPSYEPAWKKLKNKLFSNREKRTYSTRCTGVWVFFPNGERKTFSSKKEVTRTLNVTHVTINENMGSDTPIKRGNAKGCYFYSLAKEDE